MYLRKLYFSTLSIFIFDLSCCCLRREDNYYSRLDRGSFRALLFRLSRCNNPREGRTEGQAYRPTLILLGVVLEGIVLTPNPFLSLQRRLPGLLISQPLGIPTSPYHQFPISQPHTVRHVFDIVKEAGEFVGFPYEYRSPTVASRRHFG